MSYVYFHGMFSFQEQGESIYVTAPIVGPQLGSAISAHAYKWGSLSNGSSSSLNDITRGENIRVRANIGTPGALARQSSLPVLTPPPGTLSGIDSTLNYCSIRLDLPDSVSPFRYGTLILRGPVTPKIRSDIPFLTRFQYSASTITVTPDSGPDRNFTGAALHFYAEPPCGDMPDTSSFPLAELSRMHNLPALIWVIIAREPESAPDDDPDQKSLHELPNVCPRPGSSRTTRCFSLIAP